MFEVIKQDHRYIVEDDYSLGDLTVSRTTLYPDFATTGHHHEGQDEVYVFQQGFGIMQIDNEDIPVDHKSILLVKEGQFHKVFNTGHDDLVFICVFKGERHA